MLTVLFVATALAGAILNVLKRWQGFALWVVADVGLACVNFSAGEYAQGVLWVVYTGIAAWGLVGWLRHPPKG